ncbi:MAG: hypothetical protein K2X01_11585 [Cyanobacteria bacterium]|nr:hypothetical protein [Cyanobacteriota bacterium]
MSDTKSIYQEYVILYLDILGFKEKVLSSVGNPEEQEVLKRFFDVKIPEIVKEYYVATQGQLKIISFSDSIVAYHPLIDDSTDDVYEMMSVAFFLLTFIFYHLKLLVRGGFTVGLLYSTPNYDNLFGPGLIDAVKWDNGKYNPYPRIGVSEEFIAILRLKNLGDVDFPYIQKQDEKYFFDPLKFSEIYKDKKMENGYTLQDLHNISFIECVESLEKTINSLQDPNVIKKLTNEKHQSAVEYWNAYQN